MDKEECIKDIIKRLKNSEEEDVLDLYEFVKAYLTTKS